MKIPLFIARRYFLFGKRLNFINVISFLSILVVAFVTMALVIALSVFNGLESLIRSIYNTFDPEIKITAQVGKSFYVDDEFFGKIRAVKGVEILTEVIEDNALLKYKEDQMVVKVKGVSENFTQHQRMDSMIVSGDFMLQNQGKEYAIIGRGVQHLLAISLDSDLFPLQLWYPRNTKSISTMRPDKLFNRQTIRAGGVFAIEKQYDDNYIFVPIDFAKKLVSYEDRRTSLEIKTKKGFKINKVRDELKILLGDKFKVLNSDEQHESLLKAVKIEKLFMFFTISFILVIASMNIFFCLTMLAINKKKDVAILYAMGATPAIIRKIFLIEGSLIAFSGAALGLLLGVGLCLAQQKYGMVSMGMETALVDAYPVSMKWVDFLSTGAAILIITILASYRPAKRAAGIKIIDNL